jgi:cytochrome c-type biogenesis protein CcmH/NrfG
MYFYYSFEPNAEKVCEDLLSFALQTDPGNPEALQALASVRMSQQRPDDGKQCLEQAWSAWKDLELGMYLLHKPTC